MTSNKQAHNTSINIDMNTYLSMVDIGQSVKTGTISSITGTIEYWDAAEPHNVGKNWEFWLKPTQKYHTETSISLMVDENNPAFPSIKSAAESKSKQEFLLNVQIQPKQPDYLHFSVS
ncbi:MAG: hypothetical protein EZS28_038958, partial [Streblomastix strix]